jgi:hypothetical protein
MVLHQMEVYISSLAGFCMALAAATRIRSGADQGCELSAPGNYDPQRQRRLLIDINALSRHAS